MLSCRYTIFTLSLATGSISLYYGRKIEFQGIANMQHNGNMLSFVSMAMYSAHKIIGMGSPEQTNARDMTEPASNMEQGTMAAVREKDGIDHD